MTVYIAGGITGDENYKAQFAAAKRMLLREGEDRLDSTAWCYGSPRADTVMNTAELPADWPGKVYMDVCLAMIRAADLVVFCPAGSRAVGQASRWSTAGTRSSRCTSSSRRSWRGGWRIDTSQPVFRDRRA